MGTIMIEKYTGINIPNCLSDENAKKTYLACLNFMHAAFGDNVEYEHMLRQILLCDDTRDYLYSLPPQPVKYVKGTRPVLEAIVEQIISGCQSEREKVLAILCYIRDLHKGFKGVDLFMGGTEEELIKKREWFCERVGRLMVGLCEIAGFPGRIVFHVASGHITSEIYFEGKWGFLDPRFGMFFLGEEDQFLSVDELVHNREAILRQSEYVRSFHNPHWSYDFQVHRYYTFCMSPLEINCITPYSLMDADTYHFDWTPYSYSDTNRSPADDLHNRYNEYGLMTLLPLKK